jgi:thioredoxin reductase
VKGIDAGERVPGGRLLVLGAGPIGIETALYAARLGYDVRVLESGRAGGHVRSWGHVTMFSPWSMITSPLGLRVLARAGKRLFADPSSRPTGLEFVRRYLEPLAKSGPLAGRVREATRAVAVGRQGLTKGDLIGDPARAKAPFRVLADGRDGETIHTADLVVDATGTFGRHRWLGDGGIPAPGEREAARLIDYGPVDLAGARARDFAGRRVLLVGAGHSAATSALALTGLVRRHPATWVVWAFRGATRPLYARLPADPLRARDRLAEAANALAEGAIPQIEPLPGAVVEEIRRPAGRRPARLEVVLRRGGRSLLVEIDRIIANVGYGPERSIYAELQVHECYATAGPMRLAAALLGEGAGGDCLRQPVATADLLANPEPGFYILGSKSFGRNSGFLIRFGLDQVRALFAGCRSDPALDLYGEPRRGRPRSAPAPRPAP